MTDDDAARQMALGLAELRANMTPLIEAVHGYREEMQRQGFAEHLAQRMAVDYHAAILRQVFK